MSITPRTDAAIKQATQAYMLHGDIRVVVCTMVPVDFARELERENAELRDRLERASLQVAACDVVAMSDTPESAARARDMHPDYKCPAVDSVARRVDECIALRADKARLRVALEKCVDTLNDPRIGTRRYMEGSEIYDDFAVAIATAKTALSS